MHFDPPPVELCAKTAKHHTDDLLKGLPLLVHRDRSGFKPDHIENVPDDTVEMVRLLLEPRNAVVRQYQALLETEGVKLDFSADGIRRIAEIAHQVNEKTENIGARRLHTVMERLLEQASYEAADKSGTTVVVATHDRRLIEHAHKRVVILNKGEIVEQVEKEAGNGEHQAQ